VSTATIYLIKCPSCGVFDYDRDSRNASLAQAMHSGCSDLKTMNESVEVVEAEVDLEKLENISTTTTEGDR
jgi:hypothetical protein